MELDPSYILQTDFLELHREFVSVGGIDGDFSALYLVVGGIFSASLYAKEDIELLIPFDSIFVFYRSCDKVLKT